jgi:hypothetical protein
MLEEDGYAAVGGGMAFLLTLAFFTVIFWGGAEAIGWLRDHLGILFQREGDADI